MSFLSHKECIEEGDTVILYVNPYSVYPITVKTKKLNKNNEEIENTFQTSYGCLRVQTLIGKPYGSKISLVKKSGDGWAHVLRPTPELWTIALPHRTQIIYSPDISMILLQLELRPGSIVLEAGTGSASLTHALARAVHPNGFVYSFDFHETRVSIANNELENHGVSHVVKVQQRDVCADGYGEDLKRTADAVFLDLPKPWEAIPHAVKCIKNSGGRLASFSPCIEQVQKTSTCLRTIGFIDIRTLECLQREFSVAHRSLTKLSLSAAPTEEEDTTDEKFLACFSPRNMPGHTGYLTFATLPPECTRIRADLTPTIKTEEDNNAQPNHTNSNLTPTIKMEEEHDAQSNHVKSEVT